MPDVSSIINMARTRIAAEAAKSTAAAEVAEGASEKAESEIRKKNVNLTARFQNCTSC